MYLGIRKDLIIVTLPYIDRALADHILISFLIESPGGGLPYETDRDARRKFWL